MSNVALIIGGRTFTVACAEGEEDHVSGLGRMIDAKLNAMGELSGQSETRMLLFAALLLADEVHDARSQPGGASPPDVEGPDAERSSPTPILPENSAERLEAIAIRLENLASRLES